MNKYHPDTLFLMRYFRKKGEVESLDIVRKYTKCNREDHYRVKVKYKGIPSYKLKITHHKLIVLKELEK